MLVECIERCRGRTGGASVLVCLNLKPARGSCSMQHEVVICNHDVLSKCTTLVVMADVR